MMVLARLFAGSLCVAGIPRRWFIVSGVLGLVGIVALTVTSPNRMHRINNWLHGTCEGDSCLQADQGLMGLAEGGWWGVGLGESRQKWGRLPAAEDDYIFAIIGEELGLVGTLGVLALFAALALVMFRMITRLDDPFMQISVAGISAWLLGQAFLNMMVVTGLLPVIGVPLPFISSGGSALLASMAALGVLLSFARREPGAQEAITARVGAVRRTISVLPAPRDAEPAPARGRSARTRSARPAGGWGQRRARLPAAGHGHPDLPARPRQRGAGAGHGGRPRGRSGAGGRLRADHHRQGPLPAPPRRGSAAVPGALRRHPARGAGAAA